MNPDDRTLVVIPALNEAATVGGVLAAIRRDTGLPVLLVDDCSEDDTADLAEAAGATVLRAPLPLGAWGAMQAGMRWARRQGCRRVVTMDADGQHDARDVPRLLAALAEADVVIGACPERGSLLRHLAWRLFRRLSGFAIEDLTSGFRAYGPRALRLLVTSEATLLDYQDLGVLQLARANGLVIVEVPVTMRRRASGKSRIFASWWAVGRYMAQTLVLCFAHWRRLERTG